MAIITVFNQKGGVGRTTTALNLLAALAKRGQRPLGIDLDPQAHLSRFFGTRPKLAADSVYSFFMGERGELADVAQITRSGVVLCPAHPDLARLDASLGKGMNVITRLQQALANASSLDSDVVIDTSPRVNALTLNALLACDLLLVPVSSDFLALDAAREVERVVNALEPVLKRRLPRRYLITRYDEQAMSLRVAEQLAEAFPAADLCVTRIREDVLLAESPVLELDVFRHAADSTGAQDYEALADELARSGFTTAR